MKILNDGIHNCRKCEIYKEYKETCSSQKELTLSLCEFCNAMCCMRPMLALMPCEQNTIIDSIDNEDEYLEYKGTVPINYKTGYCKHVDIKTMKCKIHSIRPIGCRIAGNDCNSKTWIDYLTKKSKEEKNVRI